MNPGDPTVPALAARALDVHLGERPVLQDVTLRIARGRWVAVAGPNGAGKTTLLRALAHLLPRGSAVDGGLDLLGRALADWPARERARALAWLGQGEPVGDLSALDAVRLGRLPHGHWLAAPDGRDDVAVERAMREAECWDLRARPLEQLSAGERQRVLLARALAVEAPVLLMDEPLQGLDLPHQADWVRAVRARVAGGVTVVSVLHELSTALEADELLLLREGRLVWQGATDDPATHRALAEVFGGRLQVHGVDGRWVALPLAR